MKIFKNIANIITTIGLLATVWLLLVGLTNPEELWLILILAGVVILSDVLDGFVARNLKIQSTLGKVLDPLRDKLFICSLLAILVWHWQFKFELKTFTGAVVITVILNNILSIFAGLVGLLNKIDISPNIYGKRKTFLQFLAIGIWLISLAMEKYLEFSLTSFSIYLIDSLLLISIYLGIRSLEDYGKRYQQNSKRLRIF